MILFGRSDLRRQLGHATRLFDAYVQALGVGDHREAGSLEALAELGRHADEQCFVPCGLFGVAADLGEAGLDPPGRGQQIEELRGLPDGVRALGNLDRIALAGTSPAIEEILVNSTFAGWELPLLKDRDLRYVVTDRRELAHDAVRGYFFTNPNRPEFERLLEKEVIAKFGDLPGIERVYASGDIAIYDIEGVR